MKKYIFFWIIMSISISISSISSWFLTPTIIGKWTATVHNEEISYYFTKNNMSNFYYANYWFPISTSYEEDTVLIILLSRSS